MKKDVPLRALSHRHDRWFARARETVPLALMAAACGSPLEFPISTNDASVQYPLLPDASPDQSVDRGTGPLLDVASSDAVADLSIEPQNPTLTVKLGQALATIPFVAKVG